MTKGGKPIKQGLNRRDMLSLSAVAGLSAGVGSLGQRQAQAESAKMPMVDITSLSDLEARGQVEFEYPDENSPAILLRLAEPVDGGVGPDQSIVAYSLLCTHKGCPLNWNAEQKMLICPCHWSSFDPAKQGRLIIGQGSQSLPQITLTLDDGKIRAVGVEGLIYGRQTNIL